MFTKLRNLLIVAALLTLSLQTIDSNALTKKPCSKATTPSLSSLQKYKWLKSCDKIGNLTLEKEIDKALKKSRVVREVFDKITNTSKQGQFVYLSSNTNFADPIYDDENNFLGISIGLKFRNLFYPAFDKDNKICNNFMTDSARVVVHEFYHMYKILRDGQNGLGDLTQKVSQKPKNENNDNAFEEEAVQIENQYLSEQKLPQRAFYMAEDDEYPKCKSDSFVKTTQLPNTKTEPKVEVADKSKEAEKPKIELPKTGTKIPTPPKSTKLPTKTVSCKTQEDKVAYVKKNKKYYTNGDKQLKDQEKILADCRANLQKAQINNPKPTSKPQIPKIQAPKTQTPKSPTAVQPSKQTNDQKAKPLRTQSPSKTKTQSPTRPVQQPKTPSKQKATSDPCQSIVDTINKIKNNKKNYANADKQVKGQQASLDKCRANNSKSSSKFKSVIEDFSKLVTTNP